MRLRFAPAALLGVAALWGSSFFLMKEAIKRQDVNSFLFTRFAIAFLVMLLVRPRILTLLTKDILLRGGFAGSFLAIGFILQTLGLDRTTAAITGFITGLYVVTTPLLALIFHHERLPRSTWLFILLATIGLAFLSLHGWAIGTGELFVLASAFAYGAQIILLGRWSSGRDPYLFTFVQIGTCVIICGVAAALGGFQAPPDNGVWSVAIFTALFSTALAFFIQTWAQSHLHSTKVAVILVMEIVFAALFAVIFGNEHLSQRIAIGGILIVISMYFIVSQEA